MSESVAAPAAPKSLVTKLAEVMAAVERVPKRGRNDFHGYDYATEADIAATIRKELASRNVMLLPGIEKVERVSVGDKGSFLTTLEMTFTFLDGDTGAEITRPWAGAGTDKEDKGLYKAITGGEKYYLLKAFLMATGDDPEKDAGNGHQEAQAGRGRSSRSSPKPGLPAERIGDPDRPAGDPEEHRAESERLFTDQGALPSTAELVAAFREGRKECPACHEPKIIKGKPEYGGGWVCWASKKNGGGCGWKCKDEEPKAAPTGPEHSAGTRDRGEFASGGVGGTDAHSDLIAQERRAKLLKASKLSDTLGASEDFRRDAWNTYCPGATKDTADPAQLDELIKFLELRVKQKGAA